MVGLHRKNQVSISNLTQFTVNSSERPRHSLASYAEMKAGWEAKQLLASPSKPEVLAKPKYGQILPTPPPEKSLPKPVKETKQPE